MYYKNVKYTLYESLSESAFNSSAFRWHQRCAIFMQIVRNIDGDNIVYKM